MLNGRGEGNGDDEQDGFPAELGEHEIRNAEPRRGGHLAEIVDAEPDGAQVAYGDARHNGDKAYHAAPEQGNEHRRRQRRHRNDQRRVLGDKHRAAVPGLAEGHVHPDRGQHKADDDDHRPGHDGRQQAHDDLRAAPTDDEAQHHIDGTGHDHAAQRRGKPPSLHAIDDRRNEREGRREKNGHLAACANLKNQRAHAGRKQGHVGAHARQDRHQHQRAECHEKHLRTEQGIFQPKRIRRIRLHLHSSEKNVCSLSSGGSRIPGLRGTAPLSRIGGSASPPARYRVPKMRSPASPRPGMM